jgi:hypothetical protein
MVARLPSCKACRINPARWKLSSLRRVCLKPDSNCGPTDVLRDRDERVKSGKESFMDWETAKKQLRDKLT